MYNVYSKTLLQLERELLMITQKSDYWDENAIFDRWSNFAAKVEVYAQLQSKSNSKIKKALEAQISERKSFDPESPGIIMYILYINFLIVTTEFN